MIKEEVISIESYHRRIVDCKCDICGDSVEWCQDLSFTDIPKWSLYYFYDDGDRIQNENKYQFCDKCIKNKIEPLLRKNRKRRK